MMPAAIPQNWTSVTYDSSNNTPSSTNPVLFHCADLFNQTAQALHLPTFPNNSVQQPSTKFLQLLDTNAQSAQAYNKHCECDNHVRPVLFVYTWTAPVAGADAELAVGFYKSIRRSDPATQTIGQGSASRPQQRWWNLVIGCAQNPNGPFGTSSLYVDQNNQLFDLYGPLKDLCRYFLAFSPAHVGAAREQLVILEYVESQIYPTTFLAGAFVTRLLLDGTCFKQPLYPEPPYREPAYAAIGDSLPDGSHITGWEIVDWR